MGDVSTRDRWLAALCYLGPTVFVPMASKDKSAFLARHCRQGFALLFVAVVAAIVLFLVETTLGRIPVLGFLLSILLYLVVFLILLSLAVMGFTKALAGESWRMPYIDELAERVPIESATENVSDHTSES